MKHTVHKVWIGCLAASVTIFAWPAMAASTALPPERHEGPVDYVTGGIGEAEAHQFEREMPKHQLAIEVLEHAGKAEAFTADARIKIADAQGRTVLQAQADGPFMLVDLPPGRYTIAAQLHQTILTKPATVVAQGQLARATFEFPPNTD
jgi:hypothetical protein